MKNKNNAIENIKTTINETIKEREDRKDKYTNEYNSVIAEIRNVSNEVNEALEGEDADRYAIACDTLSKLKNKADFYKQKIDSVDDAFSDEDFESLAAEIYSINSKFALTKKDKILSLANEIIELSADIIRTNRMALDTYNDLCALSNPDNTSKYQFMYDNSAQLGIVISKEMFFRNMPKCVENSELIKNAHNGK